MAEFFQEATATQVSHRQQIQRGDWLMGMAHNRRHDSRVPRTFLLEVEHANAGWVDALHFHLASGAAFDFTPPGAGSPIKAIVAEDSVSVRAVSPESFTVRLQLQELLATN